VASPPAPEATPVEPSTARDAVIQGAAAGTGPSAVASQAPPDGEAPPLEAPALVPSDDFRDGVAGAAAAQERIPVPEPAVAPSDFPLVVNDQVRALLAYFQTAKWGLIASGFERARRYIGMMRDIFREQGVPTDLLNLAFIESAVDPRATSRAKAAGIWQFMPATGRLYGMRTSSWVDERRDPVKSTRGAAEYLKALHARFGDWALALAAYNAGEGTVQRAIRQQGTRDFWSLRLPKETTLFVPAFMAMTIISREPERYGFSPPPEEPLAFDVVHLQHPADLTLVARAAGTSVEHIRELNPELLRGATPRQAGYALRIPRGRTAAFLAALAVIPPAQRVPWVSHRVRKGETAAAIARRYGVSLPTVLELNDLARRQALRPGSTILVPGVLGGAAASGRWAASNRVVRHTVKKTDTLETIAAIYGISVEDLRAWNGPRTRRLRAGEVLRVAAPEQRAARAGQPATR
jgi:membrane-bound lytic murein transglycosylase D